MSKKWQYYENVDEEKINKLQEKYKINRLLATILVNRNITEEKAEVFLSPTRSDFYDPFGMPDMEKAVDRLIKAMNLKEKVIIYGDYDVDGITSITVLKSFLKDKGFDVGEYIPNRLSEGYGINMEAVKKIAEEGYKLMITVDCGITSVKEVKYAEELGIETIVTDHHEPAEEIPKAIAVVDCKRRDNKYQFRELAGVGVTFKFIQALSKKLNLEEKEYLKYLDIVSIGTISDIVPLVDENRVITKLGLKLVACTRNLGLKSLLKEIGMNKIDSSVISFGVAPRINACGRMGYANEALKLLLTEDENNAKELTDSLKKYNNDRQKAEKKIFEEAMEQIKQKKLENANSIVLAGEGWHSGVIGIVASKITELYFKPCILICLEENANIGKGSGRSIPGFDLHEALMKCKDLLEGFGGHSMAVGLSLKRENFEKFQEIFNKIVEEANIQDLEPILKIDSVLNLETITQDTVKSISLLEPFGEANKTPIFAIKNLKIDSIRALTEGKHLKLSLKSNNIYINAIGFNLGFLVDEYRLGDKVDVAGNLEINSFNGIESIQINLKDMMKSI